MLVFELKNVKSVGEKLVLVDNKALESDKKLRLYKKIGWCTNALIKSTKTKLSMKMLTELLIRLRLLMKMNKRSEMELTESKRQSEPRKKSAPL